MFLSNLSDPEKPTFFEMAMIDETMSSLKPALSFSWRILASRSTLFHSSYQYVDEIYTLLHAIVEANSLWLYDD